MGRQDYFDYPYLETVVPNFVDHLLDEDGRPLAEDNAPAVLKEGVAFDYRPCPYAGGRDGGRMNTTALRQVASCWTEVLDDLLFLRGVFMRRYPVDMNYFLLARFADFLTSVPGFLVRTASIRWDAVPRSLSGLFKSAQGLYLTANDAILRGGSAAAFDPVSTEAFMDHTEAHRIFWVGDKVCSGPPALIRRFVGLAIDGSIESPETSWLAPYLRDDASVNYAEMKLNAQMARRVFDAWVEDALDTSLGRAHETRAPALEALNRLSGLHLDESVLHDSRFGLEDLAPLVEDGDAVRRAQGLRFCARFVPIQLHYVGYLRRLQRQIDSALGRDAAGDFRFERYSDALDTFDSEARRVLKGIVHWQRLATLVDREALSA